MKASGNMGAIAGLTMLIAGGVAFAWFNIVHLNSREVGAEFLEKKGYTQIEGGDRQLISTCGKNHVARQYSAVNPKGKRVTQTVCLHPLHKYRPIIG